MGNITNTMTQPAKMRIDSKFVALTADVIETFFMKYKIKQERTKKKIRKKRESRYADREVSPGEASQSPRRRYLVYS